ncbi:MAG: hypothetical protein ACUVWN_10870 [bacterium]
MIQKYNILIFLTLLIFIFMGCAERQEDLVSPGSTEKADSALREAENNLIAVGVKTSFDDPGELAQPEKFIPKLSELANQDKQKKLQYAIEQLNIVISELEQKKLAPSTISSSFQTIGSESDKALVHFYLGIAYLLDAVSRLLLSDDPAETFILDFDPDATYGNWFTFDISKEVKEKLDSTKNPSNYPLAFTEKERQAIIDTIKLISDSYVKPSSPSINPQSPSVKDPPYKHSAIWHFEQSTIFFGQYNPEIKNALDDFNEQINEFESKLQKDSIKWGFTYTKASWR